MTSLGFSSLQIERSSGLSFVELFVEDQIMCNSTIGPEDLLAWLEQPHAGARLQDLDDALQLALDAFASCTPGRQCMPECGLVGVSPDDPILDRMLFLSLARLVDSSLGPRSSFPGRFLAHAVSDALGQPRNTAFLALRNRVRETALHRWREVEERLTRLHASTSSWECWPDPRVCEAAREALQALVPAWHGAAHRRNVELREQGRRYAPKDYAYRRAMRWPSVCAKLLGLAATPEPGLRMRYEYALAILEYFRREPNALRRRDLFLLEVGSFMSQYWEADEPRRLEIVTLELRGDARRTRIQRARLDVLARMLPCSEDEWTRRVLPALVCASQWRPWV